MRIRSGGWVLAVGLWMTVVGSATGATTRDRILRLEHAWLKAAQQRDLPVLERVLGKVYVDIDYRGMVRSRADMLAAPNVRMGDDVQRLRDEKVRQFGDTAILTGRGELVSKRSHHVLATWCFTDVFVRQHGAWRAVSSQETLLRTNDKGTKASKPD